MVEGIEVALSPLVSEEVRTWLRKGHYEWHERQVLREVLRPEDVVLELGTGLGFLASWCAKRCRRVVTMEANLDLLLLIVDTFRRNEVDPLLLPLGVSRSGGRQIVQKEPDFWATSTRSGGDQPSLAFEVVLGMCEFTGLVMDIEGGERELVGTKLPESLEWAVIEYHRDTLAEVSAWMSVEGFQPSGGSENVRLFQRSLEGRKR